jgi:hypothetical protein
MPKFIVVRHGSNSANQPMRHRAVIGVIVAKDEEQATEVAEAQPSFKCYNNQHLELIQAKDASRADKLEARELDVINAIEQDKELGSWAES